MFTLYLSSTPLVLRALLVAGAGFPLVYILRFLYRRHQLSRLPGPKPASWIWGNEWELANPAYPPGTKYAEWGKTYGDAYKFTSVFGSTMVVLTDPRAIDHILGKAHVYEYPQPSGAREWFHTLLGKGLLWASGDEHKKQHALVAPALNAPSVKALYGIFYDSARKAIDCWNAELDAARTSSKVIDVQYWMNRISIDSIGLAAFSEDFDTLNPTTKQHPLAEALDKMTDSSAGSFMAFAVRTIIFAFPAILRLPTKRLQAIKSARTHLKRITDKIWEKAKETADAEGDQSEGRTILDKLLHADRDRAKGLKKDGADADDSDRDDDNDANDDREKLGPEEIAAEMMTMIFAGYETTSCILAFALYELARQPSIQAALRAELTQGLQGDPDFDTLHSHTDLPLLDGVVRETLRLHPPVLELHRVAAMDDVIPLSKPLPSSSPSHPSPAGTPTSEKPYAKPNGHLSNGNGHAAPNGTTNGHAANDHTANPPSSPAIDQFPIPRGTLIAIPINVLQQNPLVWGDDAHEFKPERWVEIDRAAHAGSHSRSSSSSGSGLEKGINGGGAAGMWEAKREIMAFSDGARTCIGRTFATIEIKAVLSSLIKNFTFTLAPGTEINEFVSFVVRPKLKDEKKSTLPLVIERVAY